MVLDLYSYAAALAWYRRALAVLPYHPQRHWWEEEIAYILLKCTDI